MTVEFVRRRDVLAQGVQERGMGVHVLARDVPLKLPVQAFHCVLMARHARQACSTRPEWEPVPAKLQLDVLSCFDTAYFKRNTGEHLALVIK